MSLADRRQLGGIGQALRGSSPDYLGAFTLSFLLQTQPDGSGLT